MLDAPWQLTPDEAWDLVATLLDSLRQQGVVTFPPNIDPCDEAFAPRNVKLYVRQESIIKQHILGWTPKTDKHSNRRLDYLSRLLQKRASLSASASEARAIARKALSGLWSALSDAQWRLLSVEKLPVIGVVYQTPYNLWEWVPPTENNTPIYRCTRCTAVSYHNLSGVCPTHGCDGELERVDNCPDAWRDNHYRHLYQDMALISLRAEEHTAQWRADDAARIQHQFSAGEVNLLSCSTTFELGVDLGSLNSVLMSNVPPKPANYVQRAGRAGRRSDTAAMVVTFAQRRSHDLYHYAQPMNLIAGAIPPPRIEVRNEKIVRRHVHAVLLAAFFRWARDQHGRLFRSVGSFFHPEEGLPSGPDLLRRYLSQPPDAVRQALRRIVPTDTQRELGIDDWAWLPALLGSQDELGLLDQVDREVNDDLALYAQLKSEAIRKEHFRVAEHLKRIASTVENRDLLGFLGSRNVLPKHGFPTDVVDLHTSHIELSQARQVELQRDLRMAIAEFAPGNQVVAAKYLWRAGGVRLLPGRSLQTFRYAICPECGRFHRAIAAPGGRSDAFPSNCTVCGANLAGREGRHGYYVWPEFGFVAQREPPPSRVGQERPPRLYASRVYFSEYTQEVENPWLTWGDPALDRMWLSYRHSRLGKLSLVNSGIANAGFRLCQTCGWAEPVPVDRRLGSRKHTNPRSGQPCTGMHSAYHLGHEDTTDELELRFRGALTQDAGDATWLSTLYALIEGASRELGIERDDLDGVLYPYQRGLPPALVLYDNVPGGAGHTQHIAESLERVAAAALAVVTNCECGEETSCYGCLRNYYNQFAHDQLERRLARDVLQRLMR